MENPWRLPSKTMVSKAVISKLSILSVGFYSSQVIIIGLAWGTSPYVDKSGLLHRHFHHLAVAQKLMPQFRNALLMTNELL